MPRVITCFEICGDGCKGLGSVVGHVLPFLIDFDGRLYNAKNANFNDECKSISSKAEGSCN